MKRKFAFALVSISAVGGAWSCITLGQDPFGPARTPRASVSKAWSGLTTAGSESTLALVENNLDENVAGLARQLKTAEGAEKDAVAAKLKSAVGEQFDQRQEGKAKELKALEEQLAKLKEIHNKRTLQRDQIIADRVQQIVREVEGLGWGTDSSDFPRLRSTNSSSDLLFDPARVSDPRTLWPFKAAPPPRMPVTGVQPRR